jgi:GNAT superfamily N-acetyltransferase
MSDWKVEPLASHHVRTDFDCGQPSLNDWIKHLASQFEARDLARIYLLVRRGEPRGWGYYSVSTCQIRFEGLPATHSKGLPKTMGIPAALIGKLALDKNLQGQKMGGVLLLDALERIRDLASKIGIRIVVVDVIDQRARNFYLHFKFSELLDEPGRLFMPLSIVRNLPISYA